MRRSLVEAESIKARLTDTSREIRQVLRQHNIPQKNREYEPPFAFREYVPQSSPDSLRKLAQEAGISVTELRARWFSAAYGINEICTDRAALFVMKGEWGGQTYYREYYPYSTECLKAIGFDSNDGEKELTKNMFRSFSDKSVTPHAEHIAQVFIKRNPSGEHLDETAPLIEQAILLSVCSQRRSIKDSISTTLDPHHFFSFILSKSYHGGRFRPSEGKVINLNDYPEKRGREYLMKGAANGVFLGAMISLSIATGNLLPLLGGLANFWLLDRHHDSYESQKVYVAKESRYIDFHECVHLESADVNPRRRIGKVGYLSFRY